MLLWDKTSTFCVSNYEARNVYVLSEVKYKTAKHENDENCTMSHECKLNVQMPKTPKVFVENFWLLKYSMFTRFHLNSERYWLNSVWAVQVLRKVAHIAKNDAVRNPASQFFNCLKS